MLRAIIRRMAGRIDRASVRFWDLRPGDIVRCRSWKDRDLEVADVNYALLAVALWTDPADHAGVVVWPLDSVIEKVGYQSPRGRRR